MLQGQTSNGYSQQNFIQLDTGYQDDMQIMISATSKDKLSQLWFVVNTFHVCLYQKKMYLYKKGMKRDWVQISTPVDSTLIDTQGTYLYVFQVSYMEN